MSREVTGPLPPTLPPTLPPFFSDRLCFFSGFFLCFGFLLSMLLLLRLAVFTLTFHWSPKFLETFYFLLSSNQAAACATVAH